MLVLYIILFIASIFFYILYVGSFSFYLFAFLLVMPIILFVMLKKMSKKISVGFVNTQKNRRQIVKDTCCAKIAKPLKVACCQYDYRDRILQHS